MRKLLLILAVSSLAVACSKQKSVHVKKVGVEVPEWVINPTPGCAAGTYKMKGNLGIAMDASTHHARTNLSQQLQVMTESLIRNYAEEGEHNSENFTEDLTLSVSQSVTSLTLNGARPVKQGVSGEHYFTLVCLDPDQFADSFSEMNQLDEVVRKQLRARAKDAFKELDNQTR